MSLVSSINYSGLKLFSKCPRLYKEEKIDKTYVPPAKDYFTYGSLVDTMLTCPDDVEKLFVRVDRKVDASKCVQLEEDIKGLHAEMSLVKDKKGKTMAEKAEEGNKTAIKGLDARNAKVLEKKKELDVIRNMGHKTQVTPAMWLDCEATAESIRANPTYKMILKANPAYQVTLESTRSKMRGTLDILAMSAPLRTLFLTWNLDMTHYEEFRKAVDELPEKDRWAQVWDIKTCAQLAYGKFDPTMYAGQLSYYQDLVAEVFGLVPHKEIVCGIIVGDKDASRKMTQDYLYTTATLEEARKRTDRIEKIFWACVENNDFPPAKRIYGAKQECFACSMCSDRPYSIDKPLTV